MMCVRALRWAFLLPPVVGALGETCGLAGWLAGFYSCSWNSRTDRRPDVCGWDWGWDRTETTTTPGLERAR
ncbi:hypothetical protein IWX49DRAFT_567974 [Phyllosticta citricarpa]